ncbi:MAG: hypothetical protein ABR514_07515, partial [Chthoniobacterales bacterium]
MLDSTRRKKLLVALLILVSGAVAIVAAYQIREAVLFARLSPEEAKLVGTWEYVAIDAVGHFTLTAGHRVTLAFPRDDSANAPFRATAWGHWRLDGNEFVYDISNKKLGIDKQQTRIRLLEIGHDKVITDGHSPW